jgi:hypothetical protein
MALPYYGPVNVTPFRKGRTLPRHPTLRKKEIGKDVYWFTKAGAERFNRVKEVAAEQDIGNSETASRSTASGTCGSAKR